MSAIRSCASAMAWFPALSVFYATCCLFAVKLCIGLATASISIAADAVNNLSDGLSSLISVIGFKLAGKAPDGESILSGYRSTEYLAGLVVAFLIGMVGIEFAKSSLDRILHPAAVRFSLPLVVILALSMLVKLWLGAFNHQFGTRIDSTVLMAARQDSAGTMSSPPRLCSSAW